MFLANKPELILQEQHIESTVVVFGSARIQDPQTAEANLVSAQAEYQQKKDDPQLARKVERARRALDNSRYYEEARKLGHLISSNTGKDKLVVMTGGGPGIMEAANRGATEHSRGYSIGLNISLPFEQVPNPFITPDLDFEFHYFFIRKYWFMYMAKALVVFPGGFGTLDELFEVLTLVQTRKVTKKIPVLVYGRNYWKKVLNLDYLLECGTIQEEDLDLIHFSDDPEDAFVFLKEELSTYYLDNKGERKG